MPSLRPNLRALPAPHPDRSESLAELLQAIKEALSEQSTGISRLARVTEALQASSVPPSVTVDVGELRDVLRSLDEKVGAMQFVGPPALPAVAAPDPDRVAALFGKVIGTSIEPVFAELLAQLKLLEWRLQPSSSPTLPSHIGINDASNNKLVIKPNGSIAVQDDFAVGEILDDQTGAGAVLTFNFAAPRNLVLIQAVGTDQVARADPFGGTPSATQGIRCDDSVPTYLPITTSTVKVYAPSGMVVSVAGFSR